MKHSDFIFEPSIFIIEPFLQAADFLEKLMTKITGIAAEVVKPVPKFSVSDEDYIKVSISLSHTDISLLALKSFGESDRGSRVIL